MDHRGEPPNVPAPWQLHACGYVLVLKLARAELDASRFTPPALHGIRRGPFAYAMFVDYAQAPVGPYRELLFIPGAFRYRDRTCFTITRIYVSSEASVINGRRNWGIPKQLAQFEVEYGASDARLDRVRMLVDGSPAVELTLRHYPLGFPLLSGLIPAGLRTLRQTLDCQQFTFAPTARGPIRAARVVAARIDPDRFPAFTPADVIAAVKLPDIELWFPAAQLEPARHAP
jgi:hypothetical protein